MLYKYIYILYLDVNYTERQHTHFTMEDSLIVIDDADDDDDSIQVVNFITFWLKDFTVMDVVYLFLLMFNDTSYLSDCWDHF